MCIRDRLYGATLTGDAALKIKAYKAAATKFNSARGYNNMGVVLGQTGKAGEAKSAIEKAATLSLSLIHIYACRYARPRSR